MPAKRPPQSTLPHYKPARAATTDKTAHAKGRGAVTQVKVQTKGKGPQKVVTKLVKTAGQKRFVVKKITEEVPCWKENHGQVPRGQTDLGNQASHGRHRGQRNPTWD